MKNNVSILTDAITRNLTPDLLSPKERAKITPADDPTTGHCYVAAEALWYALGGYPWVPQVLNHASFPEGLKQGETHWYLRNALNRLVLDPTQYQFRVDVPWHRGRGCGFLTIEPSKRAKILLSRVKAQGHNIEE